LRFLSLLSLLPLLLLSACSPSGDQAEIVIADPWIRETPPGRTVAAGYLEIHNRGEQARTLLGAQSPNASRVEMHAMLHEDGMMRMREVEVIEVPAGGTAKLESGGLHLMLFDIDAAEAGNHVPVTLTFDDGWQIEARFPVRRPDME